MIFHFKRGWSHDVICSSSPELSDVPQCIIAIRRRHTVMSYIYRTVTSYSHRFTKSPRHWFSTHSPCLMITNRPFLNSCNLQPLKKQIDWLPSITNTDRVNGRSPARLCWAIQKKNYCVWEIPVPIFDWSVYTEVLRIQFAQHPHRVPAHGYDIIHEHIFFKWVFLGPLMNPFNIALTLRCVNTAWFLQKLSMLLESWQRNNLYRHCSDVWMFHNIYSPTMTSCLTSI